MIQNVIIDSNLLYSDPFFKETFGKLLIKLSTENKIKIYLSSIVLEEVVNNYTKLISDKFDLINKEVNKINKISLNKIKVDLPHVNIYEKEILDFYSELAKSDVIKITEYKNQILSELVSRSIKRVKPFTEKKQEFRDAIIWLSIVDYFKINELKHNVFLTNNKVDFWDSEKKQLHQDLLRDFPHMVVYSNYQEYFTTDPLIKEITKETKFREWMSTLKIDKAFIIDVAKQLWHQIKRETDEKIKRLEPSQYFDDVDAVFFEADYTANDLELLSSSTTAISNFALIVATLKTKGIAIIYPKMYRTSKTFKSIEILIALTFKLAIDKNATLSSIDNIEIKSITRQ